MKSLLTSVALALLTIQGAGASSLPVDALIIDFDDVVNNGVTAYAYDQFFFNPTNFQSDTKCAPSSDGTPNGNCLQDERQGLITIMTRPADADGLEATLNGTGSPTSRKTAAFGTTTAPKDLGLQTFDLLAFYFVLVGNENANNSNTEPSANYIATLDTSLYAYPYLQLPATNPYPFTGLSATNCEADGANYGFLFHIGGTYDGSAAGCSPIVQNFDTGLVEALKFNTPYLALFTQGEFNGVKSVAWYASDEANTRLDCVTVRYPGSPTSDGACGVTNVPLPPALPVFGAALALAGLGVSRKKFLSSKS